MGMGEGGDAARPLSHVTVDAVQFLSGRLCGWLRAFGGRGVDGAVMTWLEHHDLGKV
jgi:hypothetical protein